MGNNMFAYCQNSPVMNYDPTGHFRVNLQYKELEGGIGGPGGGAIIWGLAHLLEEAKDALVSLSSLLALVQTALYFDPDHGEYFVYVLFDKDQNIQYVGRTKDPVAREQAHALNPVRKDLSFHIIGYNLTYAQVRGLEQALMLYCHTIDNTNSQNNQINGISLSNGNIDEYINAAQGALGYLWNQFSNEVLCWLGQ